MSKLDYMDYYPKEYLDRWLEIQERVLKKAADEVREEFNKRQSMPEVLIKINGEVGDEHSK